MIKKQPEFELQKAICSYISIAYPNVMFLSDTVASIKLTIPQQARNKAIQKNGFKTPDLLIFEPRNEYCGLFIELKTESPFKRNGVIKASQNDHLLLQSKSLFDLHCKGYYTCFSWTFEMTKKIIDEYLK